MDLGTSCLEVGLETRSLSSSGRDTREDGYESTNLCHSVVVKLFMGVRREVTPLFLISYYV
jgi:hypothetical protein